MLRTPASFIPCKYPISFSLNTIFIGSPYFFRKIYFISSGKSFFFLFSGSHIKVLLIADLPLHYYRQLLSSGLVTSLIFHFSMIPTPSVTGHETDYYSDEDSGEPIPFISFLIIHTSLQIT